MTILESENLPLTALKASCRFRCKPCRLFGRCSACRLGCFCIPQRLPTRRTGHLHLCTLPYAQAAMQSQKAKEGDACIETHESSASSKECKYTTHAHRLLPKMHAFLVPQTLGHRSRYLPHHLALCISAESPKPCTWIHLVADHFSPLVVAQLPCRLDWSVVPSGFRLHKGERSVVCSGSCLAPYQVLTTEALGEE